MQRMMKKARITPMRTAPASMACTATEAWPSLVLESSAAVTVRSMPAAEVSPQLLRQRSTPCAQLHALGDTSCTSVVGGYIATREALFVTRELDCCTTIDNASVSVESPLL